jgi:putative heme-binding domain-containing protein
MTCGARSIGVRPLCLSARRASPGPPLLAFIALTVSAAAATDVSTTTTPEPGRRTPWKSGFIGTPDIPPPYTAEPAFPQLIFNRPVLLVPQPGSRCLVVGELGGKLLSFPDRAGAAQAEAVLDLTAQNRPFGALYGLAFHPRFPENRSVYLCYALPGAQLEGTRVSRFTARRIDPVAIDLESEEIVLTFPSGGHNGGCLAFGPDGFLYISTGDAAEPTPPDPLDTGQDISDLLSSILRIDVDHREPGRRYRIPADNPFVTLRGARPEVWAYGLRNPWRMSFDRATGDLWAGDVGWEQWESILRIERGGNYGWSIREGRQPVRPEGRLGPTPILPPAIDHPHSEAASITGGHVYRGRLLHDLVGSYVYGDYQSGKVWGLKHDGRRVTWHGLLADTGLRLVSFGEDSAGELYLVEHERTNQIYRLVPNRVRSGAEGRDFPRRLSQTGLFTTTRAATPAPGVVPYRINAEAWADGARATRFLAIPGEARIAVDPDGIWKLPEGTVLARTVTLDVVDGDAREPRPRRLETQVLHREGGSWRPYSYIWNDEQSDAILGDPAGASRTFSVPDGRVPGGSLALAYRFAARSECVLCHNPWVEARGTVFGVQSASPLAFGAAQLDRDRNGPVAPTDDNPLRRLERLGYFDRPLARRDGRAPRLVDPYDDEAGLDARARSYLEVNCAHCHQKGAGGSADIALSAALALDETRTVGARPVQGTFGIDDARIVAPGEPERSVLYYRIARSGPGRMPRIGSHFVDERATRLIGDWIDHLGSPAKNRDQTPASPVDHDEVVRRITGSTRDALALVRLIDQGVVDLAMLRTVVGETRRRCRNEVFDLFERFLPGGDRAHRLGDTIDREAILKLAGDAGRGGKWFADESVTRCKSCHRIGSTGVELGPDLSAIGARYNRLELLGHILEPARTVDSRYAIHVIATRDGQVHEGMLAEEGPGFLALRDAQNRTTRIAAGEVVEHVTQARSLMPEGLFCDLTAQQAADVLEYLSACKGRSWVRLRIEPAPSLYWLFGFLGLALLLTGVGWAGRTFLRKVAFRGASHHAEGAAARPDSSGHAKYRVR